ncbi:unnamed protein product [Trichogramma brassicae]|uniref:Uncharacterized protein n=1 Tax=Trichogramma brassicae TaxID=86971 RepID=A0A6H5I490_9HYME|nr:unnamed protein product [Trichogramma brassicae]
MCLGLQPASMCLIRIVRRWEEDVYTTLSTRTQLNLKSGFMNLHMTLEIKGSIKQKYLTLERSMEALFLVKWSKFKEKFLMKQHDLLLTTTPGGLYPTLNPQAKFDLPDKDYNPPHPHRQPATHQKSEDAFGSTLDKVGLAVGGLVAAGGVAAAMHAINKQKKKHDGEADHAKSTSPDYESGLGGLGALGAALASSLASNSHAQQGYPSDSGSGGMIGSLLGALGGGQATAKPNYNQQTSNSDPFGGALGSILGGVLGGGSHQQQPTYQTTGGYPQNQPSQSGGGNDLFGDLKGALFKSAMDDITKHLYPNKPQPSGAENPHPTYHGNMSPPSHDPPNPPRGSGPGKLSAAEISKGLGLSDDEN